MNVTRTFPVFTIVFTAIYALCVESNWALFSYFPILGKVELGTVAATRDTGPVMYWYGWLATSAIGAVIACVFALMLPRIGEKLWPALCWAIPLVAMIWTTWVTAKIWFF
jgi:hypothetical protein